MIVIKQHVLHKRTKTESDEFYKYIIIRIIDILYICIIGCFKIYFTY